MDGHGHTRTNTDQHGPTQTGTDPVSSGGDCAVASPGSSGADVLSGRGSMLLASVPFGTRPCRGRPGQGESVVRSL